ncbi:MAG: hypothetical protein JXQ93_04385 [Flavobacteriaceae bacterium]
MLSENTATNEAIVDAIAFFHKNDALPNPIPAGIIKNGDSLEIAYGFQGNQKGSVKIKRGQFEVAAVTKNGAFVALNSYNHSGKNQTKQNYIDALKQVDLNSNQVNVSAIIILLSESCRSSMVSQAITSLLDSDVSFSDEVWSGLEFAFKNYSSTASFNGYKIQAGEHPWTWLKASSYLSYINSAGFTGDKPADTSSIDAVKKYIVDNS